MALSLFLTMLFNALRMMSSRKSDEARIVVENCSPMRFRYQEMITHLAMNSHPDPKNILVIGGGDGGVLREVFKHPSVESAVLCDIDEAVIRLSKKYLPGMSIGFRHPNASIHIGDGFEFLRHHENQFDVIITDSSDPNGPAKTLFEKSYFKLLNGALREGGVIITQGNCHSPYRIPSLIHTYLLKPILTL